jgi:hypothetical protein
MSFGDLIVARLAAFINWISVDVDAAPPEVAALKMEPEPVPRGIKLSLHPVGVDDAVEVPHVDADVAAETDHGEHPLVDQLADGALSAAEVFAGLSGRQKPFGGGGGLVVDCVSANIWVRIWAVSWASRSCDEVVGVIQLSWSDAGQYASESSLL